jgi:hypothetical protein
MGIKGLFSFLDLQEVDLTKISKFKRIAIDISCWLHKVKYTDNCALAIDKNHDGWKCALINIFKPFCKDHELIFVFDGKTPEIKRVEHERRRGDYQVLRRM